MRLFAQVLRAIDAGRGVAIATVVGASGSTPRHLSARMAVADDGEQWGTVGGGRIEERVVAAAREVARGGEPRVVRHHLVQDLAMCCGGSMAVAVTPAAPSREVVAQLATLAGPHVLHTPVDGAALVLRGVADGDPREPRVDGDALVEIVGAVERAVVFGLGHVGRAVGPLLASLGFAVIACDDDETGAASAGAPWASTIVDSFDVADVERAIGTFGPDDYVLVVTRDHAVDQKLLEVLLARDELAYLGMIGSLGKVLRFKKRFEARGLLDGELGAARWARLAAPIGLDVGAETPEEIAVAIAAQLVEVRRRGRARPWRG
nr:XdhC family protein [Kofleriaceae bacterium]